MRPRGGLPERPARPPGGSPGTAPRPGWSGRNGRRQVSVTRPTGRSPYCSFRPHWRPWRSPRLRRRPFSAASGFWPWRPSGWPDGWPPERTLAGPWAAPRKRGGRMTRIPVGKIYHEPLSRFGRAVADGDVTIVPKWKAREIIRQQSRSGLERLVRAIECDIDELTWNWRPFPTRKRPPASGKLSSVFSLPSIWLRTGWPGGSGWVTGARWPCWAAAGSLPWFPDGSLSPIVPAKAAKSFSQEARNRWAAGACRYTSK